MSVVRRLGAGALAGAMALLIATPFVGDAASAPLGAAQDVALAATPAAQQDQDPRQVAPVPDGCSSVRAMIKGTTGNDRLVGTPGRDIIDGSTGNDVIDGAGDDLILMGGSTGNDTPSWAAVPSRSRSRADRETTFCAVTRATTSRFQRRPAWTPVLGEDGDDLRLPEHNAQANWSPPHQGKARWRIQLSCS